MAGLVYGRLPQRNFEGPDGRTFIRLSKMRPMGIIETHRICKRIPGIPQHLYRNHFAQIIRENPHASHVGPFKEGEALCFGFSGRRGAAVQASVAMFQEVFLLKVLPSVP